MYRGLESRDFARIYFSSYIKVNIPLFSKFSLLYFKNILQNEPSNYGFSDVNNTFLLSLVFKTKLKS